MIPLSYNVRNLVVRKTTTVAAALGIALVVFVLAAALMLLGGIRHSVGHAGHADTAVVLRHGSISELTSMLAEQDLQQVLLAPGIRRDRQGRPQAVAELLVNIAVELKGRRGELSLVEIRGVTEQALAFRPAVRIVEGRPARPGTDEALVGKRLCGRFRGLDLGQSFPLKKTRSLHIVGVFDDGGSSYESEVWADLETLRAAIGREGTFSSIRVQLEEPSSFDAFELAVAGNRQLSVDTVAETDYFERQSEGTMRIVTLAGFLVAVFLSLGAIIGAMITMNASISQRRREIAVLRALGFEKGGIMLSFLLETVFLTSVGGMCGSLAALGLGRVTVAIPNMITASDAMFGFTPSLGVLAIAFSASVVMGVLGGLLPAFEATRVSPAAAMRI